MQERKVDVIDEGGETVRRCEIEKDKAGKRKSHKGWV